MENNGMYGALRIVSYVVLLSMAGSFLYAAYITLTHWTGIGV